jgi:hypothetical protein
VRNVIFLLYGPDYQTISLEFNEISKYEKLQTNTECSFIIDKKCYYLSNETMSWNVSRKWCLDHLATLLVIKNDSEFDKLRLILLNITTGLNFWVFLKSFSQKNYFFKFFVKDWFT